MLFQQIVVSVGVVNRGVQNLLHSVMGLERDHYRYGASPGEGASLCVINWRVQSVRMVRR